jgi:hypothetical protein
MTAPAIIEGEGVDNFDWLQSINDHPDLTTEHLLAAYAVLGVKTELTEEQRFWLLYHLETYGFVRAEAEARSRLARLLRRPLTVRYEILLPDEIVPDSQLEW